jgi:RNA polymerase sigma-70 factor (ECF subfamily)
MQPDDRELIMEARTGNAGAFEELVCRYDRKVINIAMSFTGDSDQAKDIYQEVFLRVHRSLDRFRFQSQFSTWLYRIATNVSLSHVSAERRRNQVSIDWNPEDSDRQHTSMESEMASSPKSLEQTFSREIADQVETSLQTLSPQQRAVFVLRHFEGHRLREIAEILQCAEGTVKKHLFTATARMRNQLKELHA